MADDYRPDAIDIADGGEEPVKSKLSANTAEMKHECSTTHNQEDHTEVLPNRVNEDGSINHDSDNGQPHNPEKQSKLGTLTRFISTAVSKMLPKTEALEYLENLVKDGTITIEDWDKKRKLIENVLVVVPVIGRVKAGKSTLLNALLGKKLLPMVGLRRGTARNISISFYKSKKTPKLTSECKGEKTVLAKGSEDIYTKLTEVNKSARNSKEDAAKGAAISYHLKTSPPHLHNIGKKNPLLVDVPGVNEAGAIKAVRCDAEHGVASGAIYLIVISCRDLAAAENIELLKNVIRQDEDAIKDKRVLIAATQYDANYEESTGDSQAIPQEVVDSICETCADICFPSSHIIHVSGKWALFARLLRTNASDSELRSDAKNQYERYRKTLPPAERGHEIQAMDSVSLADALEKASNIKELESRLNEMIADDSVTIMKQKSKTAHMVETAIEQLTATIDENDKSIKAYNIKIEKLSAPLTKLQQLTDGLRATTKPGGRRSQLYQDLAKQYKEDLDPSWEVLEREVKGEMKVFKQTCHDKAAVSAGGEADYLPELFEEDVTAFLDTNSAAKLRQTVLEANIDGTEEIYSKHVEQVYETSAKITEQLLDLNVGEKSSQVPQPAAGQEGRGGVRTALYKTEVRLKDIKNVTETLPPIPLWTGWEKFKALIRVALTKINPQLRHEGDPQNLKETMRSKHSKACVSTENVEQLLARVTTHVLAECRDYIFGDSQGSCLDVVVQHYCKSYKEKVDQVLSNYRDCHQASILAQQSILAQDQDSKKKADRTLKGYEEKKKKLVEYKRSLAAM